MLKFFYAPETCALASHLALEFVGAEYEAVRLDFTQGAQRSAEYLRINPKGRVPALVTERGVLTETPAILLYVAQMYPQAELAPFDDAFELARLNAFNSYLCSTVHVAHAHGRRGARWSDDEAAIASMRKKVPSNMSDCMALIESELFVGPWALGAQFTVSDLYLFTVERWLERDRVDIERFPKLAAHKQRLESERAVSKVLALHSAS
jgi:glutathione S-transferase